MDESMNVPRPAAQGPHYGHHPAQGYYQGPPGAAPPQPAAPPPRRRRRFLERLLDFLRCCYLANEFCGDPPGDPSSDPLLDTVADYL